MQLLISGLQVWAHIGCGDYLKTKSLKTKPKITFLHSVTPHHSYSPLLSLFFSISFIAISHTTFFFPHLLCLYKLRIFVHNLCPQWLEHCLTHSRPSKNIFWMKKFATSSEWPSLDRVNSFRLHYPGPSSNPTSLSSSESNPTCNNPTHSENSKRASPLSIQKIQGRGGCSLRTDLKLLSAKITRTFWLQNARVLSMDLNEL